MRLRSLLLLAVILAPNSAMIAADNLDESQAIREIERLGGKIKRDDKLPGRPVTQISFGVGSKFEDMDVPLLKPLTKLTTLDLSSTKISGTNISGAGLKELRGLKYLRDAQPLLYPDRGQRLEGNQGNQEPDDA